ncbi:MULTISPECIES: DeoR/GlpR family DNA-binding transcription regulator [unclassified Paenibacillus]|uniref:DeoR/GlpR family DNA-binding transcription regulator n=1 Tax=unclassified Paenibacillus TaxID=185978 RepID=UPI0009ADCA13|nr:MULTISPECIES: DeoR/GlpR family DNA-binding transcription regulator [unclassified Paenibacillus]MBE1445118.1 DeoR family transcriptional regulator of aga operon [Paenibacillus sp. OAS669]
MGDQDLSKGEERRSKILTVLKTQGRITIQDIMDKFGCSEATARRDLDYLVKTEAVIRTIGGAQFEGISGMREASFHEKRQLLWVEKEIIAAKAASLIEEGDVIGLTGGTTTYLIAKEIKTRRNITVVTNAVNIAMELADSDGVQVVLTGGVMRKNSFELCGPLAEKIVEGLNLGKMFMGADGLALEQGVTTYSELEAQIARLLIQRSVKTYAVVDHSKIGKASLFGIVPLSSLDGCITDAPLSAELAAALDQAGIEVYIADSRS